MVLYAAARLIQQLLRRERIGELNVHAHAEGNLVGGSLLRLKQCRFPIATHATLPQFHTSFLIPMDPARSRQREWSNTRHPDSRRAKVSDTALQKTKLRVGLCPILMESMIRPDLCNEHLTHTHFQRHLTHAPTLHPPVQFAEQGPVLRSKVTQRWDGMLFWVWLCMGLFAGALAVCE